MSQTVMVNSGGTLLSPTNFFSVNNIGGSAAGIGIVIDGGGSTITTGSKGYLEVPYGCTINRATIVSDQTGSIVIDVKKATYANFPTTASIAASAKPTLTSARKSQDSTLTGWTTAITAGDILEFVVDSVTTVTRVQLVLKVTK